MIDETLHYRVAPSVRSAHDEHGLVLLDTRSGAYLSFNPVGALIWSHLETGATGDEIVERVRAAFPDAEGGQIGADVADMLGHLRTQGLIVPKATKVPGAAVPGAAASTGSELAAPSFADSGCTHSSRTTAKDRNTEDSAPGSGRGAGLARTLRAWLYLIYIDFSMQLRRYRRFYDIVDTKAPRGAARKADEEAVALTCRAVDAAAGLYVKRAWCLQRSAACVCLLRSQGLPAELVLGVRTFPFEAHAWVELEGRILNDKLDYVGRFLVLDRL